LFSETYEVVDHLNQVTHDRRGTLATFRAVMRVPGLTWRQEPLATLGDALALGRVSVTASGVARGSFDVGPDEGDRIFLVENDSAGCRRRAEVFPSNHLTRAVIRLYERYSDLLAHGLERDRAAATARSVEGMVGKFDVARWAQALAPSVEFVDH